MRNVLCTLVLLCAGTSVALRPSAVPGSSLRLRTVQTARLAAPLLQADSAAQDQLIARLRTTEPQELPQVLAENMKVIDQRFFLRLAEMSDAEDDEFEKLRIRQLATAVTNALEAILKRADEQLDADATAVQSMLRVVASESGEFELPVPAERVVALRGAMRGQLSSLDEGFVGTVKAYMKRASDDGLDGMVEVLRQLLQAYAAERLVALAGDKLGAADAVSRSIAAVLAASSDDWDAVLRETLNGEDAECGCEELLGALQDKMGEVVLGMPAGSAVQSLLAEYLNELITRARTVGAED